jgi:hypothetical protein
MQRVQWHDPAGSSNWGLGFIVDDKGGDKMVGHDGACPGYRTITWLDTKTGIGVAVFINALGVNPAKFADGILKVLNSYASTSVQRPMADVSAYEGIYDADAEWGSEQAIFPWKGKLIMVALPTSDPIGSRPRLIKSTPTKDLFRFDRPDDLPGLPLRFERDGSGKVKGYWLNNNWRVKGK